MFWSFCSSPNRNMFAFSPSNLCLIFANLLFASKFSSSHAYIPPPKGSREYHRPKGFTEFGKRVGNDFVDVSAESDGGELSPPEKMTIFRLPTHIRPQSYTLKMLIDIKKFEFFGEVRINVSVSEKSNTVLLHSHNLGIEELKVYHRYNEISTSYITDRANQILNIQTRSSLLKNEVYEIKVKFNGLMNTKLQGIYSSLNSIGNEIKYMATTQFEPIQARQAFPCFDEPHFRATFDISVARYQYEIALSNMPVASTSSPDPSIDNRVWNTFERTPPMPTYLVAFVVAEDLARLTEPSGKFKLWAKKTDIENYRYAQSVISRAVKYTQDYTGIGYMLPHLRAVAVQDFQRGAMENWGLMIFKSKLIKFNENEDDSWHQNGVLTIIMHEIIHQWFGNYVTIKWWDTLWLKEGFATMLSYEIGALVDPKWNMDDIFIRKIKVRALEQDGIVYKTPMTHPVNTPAEINDQYNVINYEKAASVLRMLKFIVSPVTFQKALHIYLNSSHRIGGGVASPDDLWTAMDTQLLLEKRTLGNGLTVGQTMKLWTSQVGYPLITVYRYNKGNRDDIGFKQEPYEPIFAEVGALSQDQKTEREWIVPLTCATESKPDFGNTLPTLWLLDKNEVTLPSEVRKDEWIVCNTQQTGYYRLNYDEKNWKLIAEALISSPNKIHRYNRHQIIHDVFTLLKGHKIPYNAAFKIIRSLDNENETLLWETVTPLIDELLWHFEGTKAYEGLKEFFLERLNKIYQKIGFYEKSNDAGDIKKLRPRLLQIMCELGHTDCLSKAVEEFNKYDTIDRVPSYLQYTVISAALTVNFSSDLTWKKLRTHFKKQKKPQDNDDLIISFRSMRDESTIKKFLSELSEGKIDGLQSYFLGISLNQYDGVTAAMHFVRDILPKMGDYKAGEPVINIILTSISVKSCEQMNLLNGILDITMKLNSTMYENIIKILNSKKREGEENVKILEQLSRKFLAALYSASDDQISPATTHGLLQTSASGNSYPLLIYYYLTFIFISSLFFLCDLNTAE